MPVYTPHEVDRLYRSLPTAYDDAMLAQPTYSDTPTARRPPDELPERIAWMMTLWQALEDPKLLTNAQRHAFKAVVMGIVRQCVGAQVRRLGERVVLVGGTWQDVFVAPMTYRQAGNYLDLDEKAVGESLRRARVKLAKRISDEEEAAA